MALAGLLQLAIKPSIRKAIEQVRLGTLDFVLLKPADAQFLISTSRFELQHVSDVVLGFAVVAWALQRIGHVPSAPAIASVCLLLVGAVLALYSVGILCVSLAFITVRSDGVLLLLSSLFDAARWPSTIYRGPLAFVFTFIVPVAMMTTYPALAVLDRLEPHRLVGAVVATVALVALSRAVWQRSIARHIGAGG